MEEAGGLQSMGLQGDSVTTEQLTHMALAIFLLMPTYQTDQFIRQVQMNFLHHGEFLHEANGLSWGRSKVQ